MRDVLNARHDTYSYMNMDTVLVCSYEYTVINTVMALTGLSLGNGPHRTFPWPNDLRHPHGGHFVRKNGQTMAFVGGELENGSFGEVESRAV